MPVKGKRCVLDGKEVRSLDRFYEEISAQLEFPGHFGRNLDALWDVLTADIEGPIEVVWEAPDSSREAMGRDFDRVLRVLRRVDRKRKDFLLRVG
ncbi:MAG: barnase inhibitor barstar [Deltaproteobacteria bacterium]|nr:barnase inhibitor barstar [Deltaproteobacteria bacterium]